MYNTCYLSVHSNLDIANKSVIPFFFTISNLICLVNPQNGIWALFTISRNSLYQGSLYQSLSVFALRSLGQGYLEGVGDIMLEKYYNRQPTPFSQEIMHLKWFF